VSAGIRRTIGERRRHRLAVCVVEEDSGPVTNLREGGSWNGG
jgi:hypothetical protein